MGFIQLNNIESLKIAFHTDMNKIKEHCTPRESINTEHRLDIVWQTFKAEGPTILTSRRTWGGLSWVGKGSTSSHSFGSSGRWGGGLG